MLVFWWQGRGYQTAIVWLLTLCVFGAVVVLGKPYVPDQPWYWGAAFCVSGVINWIRGTSLNAARLSKFRPGSLKQRLFYKARHRFMGMPMETFSLVLVLVGLGVALGPMIGLRS